MPEVLRIGKLKFVIYYHDHWPPHVHIYAPDAVGKFEIYTARCLGSKGFNQRSINLLGEIILDNQDLLIKAWEEYEKEKK